MPIVKIQKPNIITFTYKQLKDDDDYGSCLWARFNLDLVSYTMTVESDCGNYSYSWSATPKTESFLHLCSRFNKDYLLEKFSNKNRVDVDETVKAIFEWIELNNIDINNPDLNSLKEIEFTSSGYTATFIELEHKIDELGLNDIFDAEEINDCIIMDYPYKALKIVDVFIQHIKPKIKEYEEGRQCD